MKPRYLLAPVCCVLTVSAVAQDPRPTVPPKSGQTVPVLPKGKNEPVEIAWESGELLNNEQIVAHKFVLKSGEYTLSGEELSGRINGELIITGQPRLTFRSETVTGDEIRFNRLKGSFRVRNASSALTPAYLQSKLSVPLYVRGRELSHEKDMPYRLVECETTTCDRDHPHYQLQSREIELIHGKRVVLHRTAFVLYGRHLFTIQRLVIPLDQQIGRHKASHLPNVGRSETEGMFIKSTTDFTTSKGAPGLFRLDAMEKKGIGVGVDQAWNTRRAQGLAVLYYLPLALGGRSASGRFNDRLNLGGGQTLSVDADYQKDNYLSLPESTNSSGRFSYQRTVTGSTTTLSMARQQHDSATTTLDGQGGTIRSVYSTRSLTGSVGESLQPNKRLTITANADYSENESVSPNGAASLQQKTAQITTRLQTDYRAENYLLQLSANKTIPIASTSGQSYFSGIEKLPELSLTNFRFRTGPLARVPMSFLLSFGRYSEGASSFGGSASGNIEAQRVIGGFDINNLSATPWKSADLKISGGFQQYFYDVDGIAQYVLRNTTQLTQSLGHKSGLRLSYTYQRPEGGTPFRFDQQGRYHNLNADAGLLDDKRLQITARVGYDFQQAAQGSFRNPWQTFSLNIMSMPVSWATLRAQSAFDPNTGKFNSMVGDFRFRGPADSSVDLVSRYDPERHRMGQINGYINTPVGKLWRVITLFQWNGYIGKFESRSLQITRDLHCLEASFTYVDNPFGFRNDKTILFQLRIKGTPRFQSMGVGQFGQALDPGIGSRY